MTAFDDRRSSGHAIAARSRVRRFIKYTHGVNARKHFGDESIENNSAWLEVSRVILKKLPNCFDILGKV